MLGKILNGESKTITSAALLLGGASLASRLLGVIRDRVLAGSFGAGSTLDAYYAAFRIPDIVFNLLVFGALSAGFIPVFTEYLMRKEDEAEKDAWRLTNEVIVFLGLAIGALAVLLIILAPFLVPFIAPGFNDDQLAITITLTRIMLISPVLMGISAVFGGVLQSTKRFVAFALAPLAYNIGIIIGATVLTKEWGTPGLAMGVVLGALLHLISQYLTVAGMGFRLRPVLRTVDDGVKTIARLSLPRIASLAVSQIDLTVATIIASTLTVGSIAVYTFANNLQMVPVAFIGISYAVAAFPSLSRNAFKKDKEQFVKNVNGVARQILFFVVPLSIIFLLLRAQIIRVVLGTGAFDWQDTIRTADTLAFFTLSIFAQSVSPLLSRAFYALKDSTTPFLVAMVSVGVAIIGNLTLSKLYGVFGLALAFSIASIVQVTLLWVLLRMKIGSLQELALVRSLMKITTAVVPAALAIQLMKNFIGPRVNMDTFIGVFTQGAVAGLVGLAVYVGVAIVLRSEEAIGFAAAVKRRVGLEQLPVVSAEDAIET